MTVQNSIFIATSLDGYIADKKGGLDWLNTIPNPDNLDMGYTNFTSNIDALVMGRTTFETVCGFGIEWPYTMPVFVLSNTLTDIPEKYKNNKIYIINGALTEVLKQIHNKGFYNLYIDGGKTIQNFLKEDLIDQLIITTIPKLLGGGVSLFSELPSVLSFKCVNTELFSNHIVQNTFIRVRT